MTAVHTTPVASNAAGLIATAVSGLYNLASFVQARPDIADTVGNELARKMRPGNNEATRIHLFVGDHVGAGADVPARMASLAADAVAHGAVLEGRSGGGYAGVSAQFGLIEVYIYAPTHQVGKVTTRVESTTVTNWQPDPAIAGLVAGAAR